MICEPPCYLVLSARYVWIETHFPTQGKKMQYWHWNYKATPNKILSPGVCTPLPYILLRTKIYNFTWIVFQQSHGISNFYLHGPNKQTEAASVAFLEVSHVISRSGQTKYLLDWIPHVASAETQDVWTRFDEQLTYMPFTECNSGTIQNLPFAVNTMTELKKETTTSDNTSTLVSRNILC